MSKQDPIIPIPITSNATHTELTAFDGSNTDIAIAFSSAKILVENLNSRSHSIMKHRASLDAAIMDFNATETEIMHMIDGWNNDPSITTEQCNQLKQSLFSVITSNYELAKMDANSAVINVMAARKTLNRLSQTDNTSKAYIYAMECVTNADALAAEKNKVVSYMAEHVARFKPLCAPFGP